MVVDWIIELFDATGFLTRGRCGPWTELLQQAYVVSNGVIALAYFLISIGLYVLWKKRKNDFEYSWILLCFTAFITACGFTHVSDITVWWWPGYRLFTAIDVVTAVLSIGTAMAFPWVASILLRAPTPQQFERLNTELQEALKLKDEAIEGLRESIAALSRQVGYLEQMRKTGLWVATQEAALHELRTVLHSSRAKEGPE
jgi:hypothetical protein